MNILIVANKLPYPPKDGGSIATLNLALGLQQAGNQVSILAMNTSKHYFNTEDIPKEITEKISFYSSFMNTEISVLKAIFNLLFSRQPFNALRFIKKSFARDLIQILQKESFDVIQMEGLYVLPYIKDIRKHSDALISYRSHNIEYEIWKRMVVNEKNMLKKMYVSILTNRLERFEKKKINDYDLLIPITNRDSNALSKMGNHKPEMVIPAGIDMGKYESIGDSIYPSLFFIGALDWMPNQEGLLWFLEEVWRNFESKNPELEFHIAGRNASPELVQQIKSFRVWYYGEVESAIRYMQQYSIMIVPVLSGSGMRIKIIEGMALEKAIITTSIGAEGIQIKDRENIWIANSADEFVEAIQKIVSDAKTFSNISSNARAFVRKHYGIFEISKKLSDFYQQNLNKAIG